MTKLTPLERKIVRRAAEIAADRDWSSIDCLGRSSCRLTTAMTEYTILASRLCTKFRTFYDKWHCPFDGLPQTEELRTTRVLLLLTFLHFDGVIE